MLPPPPNTGNDIWLMPIEPVPLKKEAPPVTIHNTTYRAEIMQASHGNGTQPIMTINQITSGDGGIAVGVNRGIASTGPDPANVQTEVVPLRRSRRRPPAAGLPETSEVAMTAVAAVDRCRSTETS